MAVPKKKRLNQKFSLSDLSYKGTIFQQKNDYEQYEDEIGYFGDGKEKIGAGTIENIRIYHSLYQRISERFIYPDFFREQGIYGMVKVRMGFDDKGNFLRNKMKIAEGNSYLRGLLRKNLPKVFQEKILVEGKKGTNFLVDAIFLFLSEDYEQKASGLFDATIGEGTLVFYVANTHPRSYQNLGKDYVAKVAGNESVDFSAIYHFVDDMITDRKKVRKKFYERKLEEYLQD